MYTIVVVIAFGLSVAVWATRPWTDTKPMVAPTGVKQQVPDTVKYQCGGVWGSASVHGPASTPRPVIGTPCGQRDERRRLAMADVLVAVVALGYLTLGRRPSHELAPPDVTTS